VEGICDICAQYFSIEDHIRGPVQEPDEDERKKWKNSRVLLAAMLRDSLKLVHGQIEAADLKEEELDPYFILRPSEDDYIQDI
jgi:hypothetical protein